MANKYIFQLRRGTRYVDDTGATLLNSDGTPVRDDWAAYTAQDNHLNPLDGELVVEFEYNPNTGKKTPRFKLGYDNNIFANLEYISPDSFILPKPISITLYADKWEQVLNADGEAVVDTYSQVVTVDNAVITANSKIDLNPNPDQLLDFYDLGVALTTENDGGVITVYVVGDVLAKSYNIQATVTEVVVSEVAING